MQSIRQVARLNEAELEKCVPPNASWHTDYRDTAYIYIGGLPFELSEGDVLTIFSQYGNPVDVKLMRDKDTGKSRGFCFLKYEDQRSCDLAVDNLSGAGVLGRVLSVDHTRYAKKEGEVETVGEEEVVVEDAGDDTDREGDERRKRRRSESESEDDRPRLREEVELAKLEAEHDDDDPMKPYLIEQKKAEVTEARERESKRKRKHSHRSHHKHRNGDDEKKASERDGPRSHRKRDAEEEEDRRRRRNRSHRSKRERSISSGRSED